MRDTLSPPAKEGFQANILGIQILPAQASMANSPMDLVNWAAIQNALNADQDDDAGTLTPDETKAIDDYYKKVDSEFERLEKNKDAKGLESFIDYMKGIS